MHISETDFNSNNKYIQVISLRNDKVDKNVIAKIFLGQVTHRKWVLTFLNHFNKNAHSDVILYFSSTSG